MGEIKKLFYSMGEVSEMLDVNPSLLRFWEKKFDILRPKKNKKGNRMFTPEDVRNLKIIYHLVKENGMTLAGAQKRMKQSRADIERDMEISERLHAIKAFLLEVKQRIDDSMPADSTVIIRAEDPESNQSETNPETSEDMLPTETKMTSGSQNDGGYEPESARLIASQTFAADTENAAESESEDDMSDEDWEREIETAFAAQGEIEEDDIDDAATEYTLCEDEDEDEIFIEESSPEDETDEEPQTETILEDGMLFAVQTVKPKPSQQEIQPAQQETEPPVRETEGPKIIEQTLF